MPAWALRGLMVYELHGLDMLVWLYYLVRGIAREECFAEIERLIMLSSTQTRFVPKTAFEREQYAKAKADGKAEAVLAVLAARGLPVSEDQRRRLLTCSDGATLDRLIARAVSAASAAEVLADL
jgi:hypothetical protein